MSKKTFYKSKGFLDNYKDQVYKNEEEVEYKLERGGIRKGAGRPSLGITKRVSLTLPESTWILLNKLKSTEVLPLSALIRHIIIEYVENAKEKEEFHKNE